MSTHCVSWHSREADRSWRVMVMLLLVLSLQIIVASCNDEDIDAAVKDQHGRMYDQ